MKKTLLIAIAFLGINSIAQAQVSGTCKKICDKQILVEEGALIGVKIVAYPKIKGVMVQQVLPNTSAEKNNFAITDIITKFQGIEINNTMQLVNLVATYKPNDLVNITYFHNGVEQTKQIALGAKTSHYETVQYCCDELVTPNQAITISLSPNPATEKVTISSQELVNGEVKISIYNLSGTLVKVINTSNKGLLNYSLDVASLIDGQYLLKINANNNTYSEKLIVAHN